MATLTEWVRRLVLLVIVASFLELLAPENALKRYVRLAVGLLVLTAVLTPLLTLVRGEDVVPRLRQAEGFGWAEAPAALSETNRRLENSLLAEQLTAYLETELGKAAGSRVGVSVRVGGAGAVARVTIAAPPGRGTQLKARAAALTGLTPEQIVVVEEAIP